MNYIDDAKDLSNASVVELKLIDSLSSSIEDETGVTRNDIKNLSRLIEAVVLSNEVVIKHYETMTASRDDDFDYELTSKWVRELYDNNISREYDGASRLLSNEFPNFDSRSSMIARELEKYRISPFNIDAGEYEPDESYPINDEDFYELEIQMFEEDQISTEVWDKMTSFYGIPFLTEDERVCRFHASLNTNISLDLYKQLETYFSEYMKEIEKYTGPAYFPIPPLLGMVLNRCKTFEDLPEATMSVRNDFIEFVKETTELEFNLRTAENIKEQIKILKIKKAAFENLANHFSTPQRYIQSRIFDVAQTLSVRGAISESIKQIREVGIEQIGILLIPGYYDMWKATEEIKQGYPELKRVFGDLLDKNDFI